jgi:dienelactone hydrolase
MYEPFPGNYIWNLSVNIAITMGGAIGEIDRANRPVLEAANKGPDEGTAAFFESWVAMADRLAEHGDDALKAGHRRTASTKYRRASIYYMVAERMQKQGFERREWAYRRMLETMWQSAENSGRRVERLEVPYEGKSYPALFIPGGRADGRPAPCMIHTNGLDSVKEMIYFSGIGDELAARGVSTLMIDHPGVGEALRLRGLPGRYDTEAWASPAVDLLSARADVDADAIGIMGWSLGGYFAPRATAFEPRLKLCVSWGANHLWGELQKRRLENEGENPVPHYWDHVMWVFGQPDLESFMRWAPNMTLDGVVERITVPYLITHGEHDRQIPVSDAYRSHEQAVSCPDCELRIFTDEDGGVEHTSADNIEPTRSFISDWIADRFGNGQSELPT